MGLPISPQSNQRGIESAMKFNEALGAGGGLNRTSVGLKEAPQPSRNPGQWEPQSNQRGIERELDAPGLNDFGVPQSNQRGIESSSQSGSQ